MSLLFPLTQLTFVEVFADVLIYAFPVILMFDKMIGSNDSLVSQFVMGFNEYSKMPGLGWLVPKIFGLNPSHACR